MNLSRIDAYNFKIFLACRPTLVTYTKRFENQENLLELNEFMFKIIRKFCQTISNRLHSVFEVEIKNRKMVEI